MQINIAIFQSLQHLLFHQVVITFILELFIESDYVRVVQLLEDCDLIREFNL